MTDAKFSLSPHVSQLKLPLDGVIQVPLSKGKIASIEAIDMDLLDLSWHITNNGYAARGKYVGKQNGKYSYVTQFMHRLIIERVAERELADGEFTDHINRDRLDNRRSNLRIASKLENTRNCSLYKNNKSGFKGVRFAKEHQKWQARIRVNGRLLHLGLRETPEEAYVLYVEAAQKYFGEFAATESVLA